MEESSLSDFAAEDAESTDPDAHATTAPTADEREAEPAEGADTAAAVDPTDVDPAVTTFAWAPDGVCQRCGESAPRRWQGGGSLVCPECKDWTEPPSRDA